MSDKPRSKRAARLPPPTRKKRGSAPLPAALRPADPSHTLPPAPDVPSLSALSDDEEASTAERARPPAARPELHTVMLSATDLETFLGTGTLALSAGDLETLHTRGLSIADVLAAVKASQSAEFSSVPPAGDGLGGAWGSARADARGVGGVGGSSVGRVVRRAGAWMRELFQRGPLVKPAPGAGHDDVDAEPAGRVATDDDHAALRQLACDLQAYLDGVEPAGVTPRVLVRDGRVVGVILEP